MKKIIFVGSISMLMFLCLLCKGIYAKNNVRVYLDTDKETVQNGSEIEISLNIENASTVAFTAYIYFNASNLDYVSGPDNTNVIGNRIIYVWHDTSGGQTPKTEELAKFKFKAKSEGTAELYVTGEFYDKDSNLIDTNFETLNIDINSKVEEKSENKEESLKLAELTLDIAGITPSFDKNINEYFLAITNDIQNIGITAIPENENEFIKITGNKNLKNGLNVINIKVISKDGKKENTYKINVNKVSNLELANINLETLAIESVLLEPPFSNDVIYYDTQVANDVIDLNILAIPENENAKVTVDGGKDLKEGNNTVKITVISEDGVLKKVFEINVYKRNEEEQKKFEEEQSKNAEQLEEIYETEKVSTNEALQEDNSANEQQTSSNKFGVVIVVIIIGIAVAAIGVYYYKKKH